MAQDIILNLLFSKDDKTFILSKNFFVTNLNIWQPTQNLKDSQQLRLEQRN